jgi:hypothetical protein
MNPLSLPNVIVSPKLDTQDKDAYVFDSSAMREVVWEVASRFPMWDVMITGTSTTRDKASIVGVVVMSGREKLGSIKLEYVGRGYERKLCLTNERIDGNLQRARSMHTEDPKRAVGIVKKWFRKKSHTELMADAIGLASGANNQITRAIQSKGLEAREAMWSYAHRSVMESPSARAAILAYAVEQGEGAQLERAIEQFDKASVDMVNLKQFEKVAHTVIRFDEGYIVCYNDTVSNYTDATLPANLRAPLGMLKLVEAKQYIDGVGFKADNHVFVLRPSET